MSAASDFQEDPLAFLKHNLLLIQFGVTQHGYGEKGPHYFELQDYDGIYECRNAGVFDRRRVPVYAITGVSRPGPNCIYSYWLPYQSNRLCRVLLGNATNLMLTARMDGCSFGFTDMGNGSFTVTHANLQDDQERIDVAGLKRAMGQERNVLNRSDYKTTLTNRNVRNDRVKITTVGVHDGATWAFFYQQYEQPPNQTNLKFHGLHKIKAK